MKSGFLKGFLILALILGLFVTGCVEDENNEEGLTKEFYQQGTASWYGENFHGKKTANGEIYNMHAFTAAHKYLAFNTKVVVVNISNKKEVTVRINDRGPYVGDRIIDLSYAAAKKIDLVNAGTATVKLYIYKQAGTSSTGKHYLQLGSFSKKQNAIKLRKRALRHTKRVRIVSEGGKFKVLVGPFDSEASAKKVLKRIRKNSNITGFVVVR
ncbi:septal ring lytic transglycosylase RlpA family protein [Candidatus Dependentiae bacterium]|nr:septal ring lytic transglycosylase RlpA family protein [Candidatus Dependentiae bacterium]